MNFRPELARAVMRGEKTVTRRVVSDNPRSHYWRGGCLYQPGKSYAVCPGRGKTRVGRMRVLSVTVGTLGHLDAAEAAMEGFGSVQAFERAFAKINGGYDSTVEVWRIEFEALVVVPRWTPELEDKVTRLGYELRGAMAGGREVRLVLDECCDGVYQNEEGERVLQGTIEGVSPTNAHCTIQGRHVPLFAVLAVVRPHFSQAPASDPTDPLDTVTARVGATLRGQEETP